MRTSHTLPKAISPFLQSFDNDEREERPITVTPKLRSTRRSTTITTTTTTTTTVMPIITTITVTSPTPYPILLSRLSSATHVDETKRDKVQARWRKLGPLVKSVQYPYSRRNWHRTVLTKDDSLEVSNRIKQIIKQRLQQQQQQKQQRRQQQQQQEQEQQEQ
ncbi:unnamed protein product, partial [Onchocerca flexuosa]|uniref:Uncharacterized protein n=1 Tax=Onchocerca flexuosa TaxID=387005 RepID=A0A183HE44_9BILA